MEHLPFEDTSESPIRNKEDYFNIVDTENSNPPVMTKTDTVSNLVWDDPLTDRPLQFKIRTFFNRDGHTVSLLICQVKG